MVISRSRESTKIHEQDRSPKPCSEECGQSQICEDNVQQPRCADTTSEDESVPTAGQDHLVCSKLHHTRKVGHVDIPGQGSVALSSKKLQLTSAPATERRVLVVFVILRTICVERT